MKESTIIALEEAKWAGGRNDLMKKQEEKKRNEGKIVETALRNILQNTEAVTQKDKEGNHKCTDRI